jgi:hypothetical protein
MVERLRPTELLKRINDYWLASVLWPGTHSGNGSQYSLGAWSSVFCRFLNTHSHGPEQASKELATQTPYFWIDSPYKIHSNG